MTGPGAKMSGTVNNLYEAGAVRNIATLHRNVVEERYENETVRRSVDGALGTILAREAAARHTRLTMDALLSENKRLELDLSGLGRPRGHCESVPGKLGSLSVSSYSPYPMRAIHYVPLVCGRPTGDNR